MPREIEKVLRLDLPAASKTCLVADSPHSGCEYPGDFDYACDLSELRKAEDAGIDSLYDFFPSLGVPFLQAQFPRSYIDPNRRDTVSEVYARNPDGPYHPSEGGMLRDKCTPRSAQKIYDRPLSLKEVFNRVSGYYAPYHEKLAQLLDETHAAHGKVVHINCHSMPSTIKRGREANDYDIILGTRDGGTCAPGITEELRRLLTEKGYKVGVNSEGYRGAELIIRSGKPDDNRHSIQVEINRGLYMNEETLTPKPGMAKLRSDLKDVMKNFAAFCDALPAVPAIKPASPSPKL